MNNRQHNSQSIILPLIICILFTVWIVYFASSNSIGPGVWYQNSVATTAPLVAARPAGAGWCSMMWNRASTATTTPTNNTVDQNIVYETINVSYDGTRLVPETSNLIAGKNYKFIITPASNGLWCMTSLTIPGIDNSIRPISAGTPITIVINNAKAWTYSSVCGNMWMYQWSIIVQ